MARKDPPASAEAPAPPAPDDAAAQGAPAQRADHADVAQLSYEAARDELVALVGRLESGQVGLEESMTLWSRGEALAAHCTRWLDDAERTLAGE